MAKFKVKVKLTGLEIEVEGDSEYGAPQIAQNISRQLGKVIEPMTLIEDEIDDAPATPALNAPANGTRQRKRRAGSKGGSATGGAASQPLAWTHDATRWGTPVQTWRSPKKIMWLLHVIGEATGKDNLDMSPTEIADTFNERFRSAGKLNRANIARDLGNNSEEFSEMSGRWFLKQKGHDEAKKLIAEAISGVASAAKA
jgi:hypothetical protein